MRCRHPDRRLVRIEWVDGWVNRQGGTEELSRRNRRIEKAEQES